MRRQMAAWAATMPRHAPVTPVNLPNEKPPGVAPITIPGALRVFGLHPPPPVALLKRTDRCKVSVLLRVVLCVRLLA